MQPSTEPSPEQQVKIVLIDLVNALKSANQKGEIIINLQADILKLRQSEMELKARVAELEKQKQ
jgi:hypothetical protein